MTRGRGSVAGGFAAVVSACLLAGCGTGVGAGAARPTAPASARPSATPLGLVALLDRPFGAVPNAVHIVRVDGVEVALASLRDTDEAVALAGHRVLIAGAGHVRSLGEDGRLAEVAGYELPTPDTLVNGLAPDPDGRRWLLSTVRQAPDGTVHSRVVLESDGAVPILLADRAAAGRALVALAWPAGGPLVSDEPLGIGGYVLFRRGFGDVSTIDLTTGALRPLSPASCAVSDLTAAGTEVCVSGGHEAPHGDEPVALHVVPRSGPARVLTLPAGAAQAGAAVVAPDGHHVALAWSPVTTQVPEQVNAEVIDLDGASRPLPDGLVPLTWEPDGSLVAVRRVDVAGGDPGTYLVTAAGGTRLLSPLSDVARAA